MNAADSGAVVIAQKSIWDMTKEEIEKRMSKVARKAQQEIHEKGHPYVIGDEDSKGRYAVYPDGRKVFTPYGNKTHEGR
jgi:hypothetical protein